jgi:hypothetical protein
MPGPLTSPYAPDSSRVNQAFRIADLIRQQGYSAAETKGRGLATVSDLVVGGGDLILGSMQRRDDQRRFAAENEQIADLLASGQDVDLSAIIRRVGVDRAKQIVPMVEASIARRQAIEDRQQALADKQQTIREKANERGMDQMSAAALGLGADPYAVQQQHFGETGKVLPVKDLLPDPAKAADARARADAAGALQGGADPRDVNQNFWGATGQAMPESLLPPKAATVSFSKPEPYRLNGQKVMLQHGSDGKMYDPAGKAVAAEGLQEYVAPKDGPQQGWQWVKRNGQEVYTSRVQTGDEKLSSDGPLKTTEQERRFANLYVQAQDALGVVNETEGALTEKEMYQIFTLPQEELIGMVNRNELSENAKRYLRAFEQFTEARLRSVSGAAVTDAEYARDRRTYAKQYGETAKVNEDRVRGRKTVLDGLRIGAGRALDAGGERQEAVTTGPKEGATRPIPGYPGTELTYRNGKWIRTK